jgi:hypothetical protein
MRILKKSNEEILKRLTEIASNFDSKKDNYLKSYPHFINYFRAIEVINLENVVIGISFTYSWMPTVLKSLSIKNSQKIISILNEVKNGQEINIEQLSILKAAFNNSLVGTSKLLHFINPMKYAIWDSRVYKFLSEDSPHKYRLENIESYIEYLSFIEQLKLEKEFPSFYELMKQKVGFEITECRSLELAFFKGK